MGFSKKALKPKITTCLSQNLKSHISDWERIITG